MKKANIGLLAIAILFSSLSLNSFSKEIVINSTSIKKVHDKSLKSNATMAFKDKDYKSASELFSELLDKEPTNQEYIYKLAYSFYMIQNFSESKQYFQNLADTSNNSFYKSESKKYLTAISKGNIKTKLASKKSTKNPSLVTMEDSVIELTDDPDNNYLCNPKESSKFMRWEKEDLPLKVYIPKLPEKLKEGASVDYVSASKKAFNRWAEVAPEIITIQYVSSPDKANIFLQWNEYFKDSAWGVSTYPHYDEKLKKRVSTIFLSTKAQPGSALFSVDAVNFGEDEFIKIAIHEFGHTLGLNHSYDQFKNIDIMQPVFNLFKIDISDRDLNTLKKLYSFSPNAKVICK